MKKIILLSMATSTLLLHAGDVKALEKRVASLEEALEVSQKRIDKEKIDEAMTSKNNSFNQKAFIPDISLILNASAVSRIIKNSTYEGYGIDGFVDKIDEIPVNKNRGFNLNYAEFGMHSAVGPYFDADAIFHLSPDSFEIEEAYITTKKMPYNVQVKAGTFKSGFGRINAIHQHAQHFVVQPLVYEAMFGVEGIKDPGISVNWVAPTDTYIMLGAEVQQGSNELSFGESDSLLYVGYIKGGFDLGDYTTALWGTSIAKGKTDTDKDSTVYGVDFTLKQTIDSYSSVTWQSEYLHRDRDNVKQAGFYTQLLYDLNSNWEVGARYDALTKNSLTHTDDLKKYSTIVAYKPFEFTKLRLQYTFDDSKSFQNERKEIHEFSLEYVVEIGAHGAHAF